MIVCKFGGTSLKDASSMRRAAEIVRGQKDNGPLVVLSAIAGATNQLLNLSRVALSGDTRAAVEILSELISRHRWILFGLDLGQDVERELGRFSKVSIEDGCAIVCLVGEALRNTPGVAARAFAALGDINVLMVSQGASEINLSLVVREVDADEAVRRLHEELFSSRERPDLFESLDVEAES